MQINLVMFKGDGQRKTFAVTKPVTVIGRRPDCQLQIPLEGVSRKHCELILGDRDLKIKDLASSNGTYVNNKRVVEQMLKPGDRVSVGPIVFTVQIDGKPADLDAARQKVQKSGGSKVSSAEEDAVALIGDALDEDEDDAASALESLAEQHEDEDKA